MSTVFVGQPTQDRFHRCEVIDAFFDLYSMKPLLESAQPHALNVAGAGHDPMPVDEACSVAFTVLQVLP